jgi:NAD(P)-dependent dehydrogenase (short-subunit alcohol dehydrogenase family)
MSNKSTVIIDYLQAKPTAYGKQPRLAGKVCVVTGATGGIGSATVLRFAEEDAKGIVISDLNQELCETFVKNLKANIKDSNTEYLALAANVSKDADVAALFDQAVAKWGEVHVAVANVRRVPDPCAIALDNYA